MCTSSMVRYWLKSMVFFSHHTHSRCLFVNGENGLLNHQCVCVTLKWTSITDRMFMSEVNAFIRPMANNRRNGRKERVSYLANNCWNEQIFHTSEKEEDGNENRKHLSACRRIGIWSSVSISNVCTIPYRNAHWMVWSAYIEFVNYRTMVAADFFVSEAIANSVMCVWIVNRC